MNCLEAIDPAPDQYLREYIRGCCIGGYGKCGVAPSGFFLICFCSAFCFFPFSIILQNDFQEMVFKI